MRERVPEEPGDPDGDVDARAPQLRQSYHLEPGHPARGLVPHRTAAQQRQDLRDVVALGAHRRGAPDREPHGLRVLAGVLEIPGDQRVREGLADLPTEPGGNGLGVDRVEVPAGRQDVDQSACRRTGRARRDVTAVQGPQDVPDLVRRPRQPRHDLVAGELQHRHRFGQFDADDLTHQRRDRGGPPVPLLHALRDPSAQLLQQVDRVGRRPCRTLDEVRQLDRHLHRCARLGQQLLLAEPEMGRERRPQPRQGVRLPAPHLRGPQHGEHQVHPRLADRTAAEDVQPVADLHVLDLAEVAVDVHDELVELRVVRLLVDMQVVVELGRLHQRPDLRPHGRRLRRVQVGDERVLVEELLQFGQVAVGVRAGHRRDQVIDDRGVPAPLGLGALAGVVDDEGVDQREFTEHRVRRAATAEPEPLAGQPLHRAVLAHVHDRVGAETVLQPAVGGHVVVGRRHVRVVVDRDRVLPEAARRLDHHDDIAELEGGEHDVVPVDVQRTRRLAPRLQHGVAQLLVELVEPRPIVGERHPRGRGGELVLRQPLDVVATGLDEPVDQLVAPGGVFGERITGVPERVQHPHRRRGRVQTDRVADA